MVLKRWCDLLITMFLCVTFMSGVYAQEFSVKSFQGCDLTGAKIRSSRSYITLSDADQVDGHITLTQAGEYRISENLHFPIVIVADNVRLDAQGYTIEGCDGKDPLVTIVPERKNISFENATLQRVDQISQPIGIVIGQGSSQIVLEQLKIIGCREGIVVSGAREQKVAGCEIKRVDCSAGVTGMRFVYAVDSMVKDCSVSRCTQAGFVLMDCESLSFYSCQALKTAGVEKALGFCSYHGKHNLFQRCVTRDTVATCSGEACGFLLIDGEEHSAIVECSADGTVCDGLGVAYGICCQPTMKVCNSWDNACLTRTPEVIVSGSWTHDGHFFASGFMRNGTVSLAIYQCANNELTLVAQDASIEGDVFALAWSPDSRFLAIADSAGFLNMMHWDESVLRHVVREDVASPLCSVVWSPDGRYVACGDGDKNIRLYEFDGEQFIQKSIIDACASSVLALAWSADGRYVASGDFGGAVRVFQVHKGTMTLVATEMVSEHVWSVAWSPWADCVVIGGEEGAVKIFDLSADEHLQLKGECVLNVSPVQSVAWSPDGKYCVAGQCDGTVSVMQSDTASMTRFQQKSFLNSVYTLAWSPTGVLALSGKNKSGEPVLGMYEMMQMPVDCLIENCRVSDTHAHGALLAHGMFGCGLFLHNMCCNNDVNYGGGIGNVLYGNHNRTRKMVQEFDNISMPAV
jgi:WD40 repeat protein